MAGSVCRWRLESPARYFAQTCRHRRRLQLVSAWPQYPYRCREPVAPVPAAHRNIAVSDIWAVYAIGARRHGCPRLARFLVLGERKLAGLRIARLLVDLKQDPAPQLGREEAAQTILDENVLFHAPELRRGVRRCLQARAGQGLSGCRRVVL